MAFDFFGEGIPESSKVAFTADEENFFQAKLSYLDPKSKGSIELGTAMSFIKFSGLPPLMQKKILQNLKLLGKSGVDYIEMKKIFRGIALAQNKIEPSLVNINANIRTKMPVFYDDDDDQQQDEKPQPKPAPIVQQKRQQKVSPVKPEHSQENPRQSSQNKYRNQRPPPPPQSFKQEEKSQPEFTQTLQYKKFEQIWKSLQTKGNYISGTEVKKQFGNSSNRKELAKAWKICSQTEKGYLTKGQLFVFLFLIKDAKGNIPDTLNSKMKELIAKIDSLKEKTEKVDHVIERTEKVEKIDKSGRQLPISSSQMFDNFDKSQHFDPNKEKSHVLQKSQPFFHNMQKSQNLQKMQKLQSEMTHFHHIQEKDLKAMERLSIRAEKEAKVTEEVLARFDLIAKETENSKAMLEQVDQFLGRVEERNVLIREKIDFLKENQDNLTDRLNQTCVKMRDLIVKQAQFIDELLGEAENEIEMDKERVTILENYTEGMNEQINMKISNTKARQSKIKQSKIHIDEPSSSKETIEQKKQIRRVSSVEKIQQIQNPAVEVKEEKKQEEEKPVKNEISPNNRNKSPNIQQQQPIQSPRNKSPHHTSPNEQPQNAEQVEVAKRLHSKRVYTIQMINFITPISQEEYPIIVQRITSMTQNQLDGLYAQLYKKYQMKMQEQNKKEENEGQNNRPLTNDEFSSNNFPQVPQAQQQKQKQKQSNQDFFA